MASGSLGSPSSLYGQIVLGVQDIDPLAVNAVDTITFTEEASVASLSAASEDTLEFTDAATGSTLRVSAVDTLTLTDEADVSRDIVRSATDALTLTEVGSFFELVGLGEDTLELDEQAFGGLDKLASAEDTIDFTDTGRSSIIFVSASDTVPFNDTHNVGRPKRASASDDLQGPATETFDPDTFEFTTTYAFHDVAIAKLDTTHSRSEVWSFGEKAFRAVIRADAIECLADDTLVLDDAAVVNKVLDATDLLTLGDTATGIAGKSESDSLIFTESATVNIDHAPVDLEDTLTFYESAYYTIGEPDLCIYAPLVGANTDPNAPAPPPTTYSPPSGIGGFRLQYPASGTVTDEILLRNPNLGERDRVASARINRETRGGTLIIYADPIWPKTETLSMSFSGLSRAQAFALIEFMEDHLGEDVRLVDWEDRSWTGVISQPQDPIVQDGPGCQYTASFEFVGTKDD